MEEAEGAGTPTSGATPGWPTQEYDPPGPVFPNVYPLGHVGVDPSSHPKLAMYCVPSKHVICPIPRRNFRTLPSNPRPRGPVSTQLF